jgi:K+/H+ antiporter YhaU regulatory subunit KhtT
MAWPGQTARVAGTLHPDGQLIATPPRELQLQAGGVLVVVGEVSDLNPVGREQDRARRPVPGQASAGDRALGPCLR